MKKQQLFLVSGSFVLLVLLFFFGKTTSQKSETNTIAQKPASDAASTLTTADLIAKAKQHLTEQQVSYLVHLENSVVRGNVKDQQVTVYYQLAKFWGDSLHHPELRAYYLGEAAKLENSEKNLTFAARLLVDALMGEYNPARQNWMATEAKSLFEKSLIINPNNDSSRIGIGACYIFGNISGKPMEGILVIREIAEKNPDNLYAQMMLGLGGVKSGQYDKAIDRFLIVVRKQPYNLEAILNLAEAYERTGDKANAIKWYEAAQKMISLPEAKKELEERIKALQ